MIIKEYRCLDCGSQFETADSDPACPSCSSDNGERAFYTAPGIKSPKTAVADATVKQLAADYGLSDMSNKDGGAVKRATANGAGQFIAPSNLNKFKPFGATDNVTPLKGMFRGPRDWPRRKEAS